MNASASSFPVVREYLLDLDVNHRTLWFTGSVVIALASPTPTLRLNAVGIEITGTEPEARVTPRPESEEIDFEAREPLARWTIRFRGRASEKGLLGLYRSRYGESYILTTQCAATATRNIFPCIDRPDRRAVVHLRLTIDAALEAIFNTPPAQSSESDGRRTIEFQPTPPMATYLFYLGVGQFEWLEGPPGRPSIRGAAPPGRAPSARYAVERGVEILPALEAYFQIPFPLPKLDLIAVPEFAYGAMENWGAITFRDMRLLVDDTTSISQRRATLTTIAHEIAHQWFGNLVTMEWWTDIWLNESFATFTEEKVLEQLYPEGRHLAELLLDWTGPAKTGDSLATTHPVSVPVERPEEIGQIFDEISYGKGSAVLRMIESYIGPDAFRNGVTDYLRKHAYGNATSADLWSALEGRAGRSLRPVLEAWVLRPGLPMITARAEGGTLALTQKRFLLDGQHRRERWPIPLALPSGSGGAGILWDEDGTYILTDPGGPPRLNVRAAGFYRVRYEDALFDRLLAGWSQLPGEERWAVVDDAAAFLVSGDDPPERVLSDPRRRADRIRSDGRLRALGPARFHEPRALPARLRRAARRPGAVPSARRALPHRSDPPAGPRRSASRGRARTGGARHGGDRRHPVRPGAPERAREPVPPVLGCRARPSVARRVRLRRDGGRRGVRETP